MSAAERHAKAAVAEAQRRLRQLEGERDRLRTACWVSTANGESDSLRYLRADYKAAEADCAAARGDLHAARLNLQSVEGGP